MAFPSDDQQLRDVDSIEAIRREYRAAIAAMREEHAREVQELRRELAALPRTGARDDATNAGGEEPAGVSGRRRFLRLALGGAAAAGTAVAAGVGAGTAGATTGNALLIGIASNVPSTASDITGLINPSTTQLMSRTLRVANYSNNEVAPPGAYRTAIGAVVSGIDNTAGFRVGVYGRTANGPGAGLVGIADGADLPTATGYYGVVGSTLSTGTGVFGYVAAGSTGIGVAGKSDTGTGVAGTSTSGTAVAGTSSSSTGVAGTSTSGAGVAGTSTDGAGVAGTSSTSTGVAGTSTDGAGVAGTSSSGSGTTGTSSTGNGVEGTSGTGTGVWGSSAGVGVQGVSQTGVGMSGTSTDGVGTLGASATNDGVRGISTSGRGVYGSSSSGAGVSGSSADSTGVVAISSNGIGLSAMSNTNIAVSIAGTGRMQQVPTATAGAPTAGQYWAGEQLRDAAGDLYLCVASGTPGTWRRVTAQHPSFAAAGGSINLLAAPIRILDTRGNGAPVTNGGARLAANTPLTCQITGQTVGGISVPAGATGVLGNVSIVEPATDGWAALWPVGAWPGTANINFSTATANPAIANFFVSGLHTDGSLQVMSMSATHAVIDVFGFTY